ncbi:MAG: hypothetical protein GAK28_01538 [Luteibacter sp.]|uniref:hypothetical protein n=1 Tax=Luteibacter sp. TaxID=1886636 RepID=UPI00137CD6B9|nr:hypothetical protein [Luteibacter sp.]KAF1007583.1 MAG: hypothetical protein GAK28_01538 [Luteibacter sp.]
MTFDSLRGALAALSATGEKGFEGLIKEALSQATTIRFRLAASGTQAGTDGDSDGSINCIGYECKLYRSTLPADSVKTKLLSLQSRNDVDLWLLCTTVTVSAQLAQELREKGADFGLEVQIFDWNAVAGIPRLAILLALIDASRLESFFLEANVSLAERTGARKELDDFRSSPEFSGEANNLSQQLDVPYLSFETARRSNSAWLTAVLSDPNEARYNLDQPIAPLDTSARHPRVFRETLVSQVQTHLTASESPSLLMLTGDEGVGKSWIPFDAWLRMDDAPLLLFVSAGRLAAMHGRPTIVDIVGTFLAEQIDNKGLPRDSRRWQRTVQRWFNGTRPLPLALVIDGINQRPDHDWGFVIGRLAYELGKHNGRTIVSTRPDYYQGVVQSRLPVQPSHIPIPEWTETERDNILEFVAGESAAKLVSPVAKALRNPRLLSIALNLLGERALRDLREVSIPHLIFEHLRVTARDSSEHVDVRKFREQLKEQAKRIFDATTDGERAALRKLGDLGAAAEGRFLRLVDEDTGLYELSEDGLILTLGLALFDRIQAAIEANIDVNDLMTRLIDPIAAPDISADVVLAAALAADLRRNDTGETAMAALLVAFVDLQNVSGERLAGFMALARKRPRPFLRAAEKIWLEHPRPFRADWLEGALAQYYSDDDAWPIAICEINRWLRYYFPEHDPGFRHESDGGWEERAARGRKELAERIEALTTSERASLARLTHSTKNVWALSDLAF